jgi:Sec-independent protein translocase protein TatA
MCNRKGFANIVLISVFAICAAVAIFAGPKLMSGVHNMWAGDKNTNKQVHTQKIKYTQGYLDEKGKFIKVGDYSKDEAFQNVVAEQPPKTLMEILMPWMGLLVIAIIAIPGFGVWLYKKMRGNFSQLVTGVEEAKSQMDAENRAKLENALSRKTDANTKRAVKVTKAALLKSGEITQVTAPVNATVTVVK